MSAVPADVQERVLVLMPSTRDAERTVAVLRAEKVPSLVCANLTVLCREVRVGAGALLLTDDAIFGDRVGQLAETLRAQPRWSSVPIVVIAREAATQAVQEVASPVMDGIIVVERPVRMHSLLSVLQSALRNRQHQYQIRDDLAVRELQAVALRAQEERLRFALAAGRLGSWSLDLDTMELETSSLCKANFGRAPTDVFTYEDLQRSIHPGNRDRVDAAIRASIATGVDCDVECRAVWPNGEEHWVMIRGRAPRDERGKDAYMAGVSQDIDERKRMHNALLQSKLELAEQADRLRDTDRRKDEFLATLAHELRNPLAPIRTGIDVLRSNRAPAVAERLLGIIDRQITHMVRLIDDLLDVSRITRGVLELRKQTTTLGSVLDAAVEASRSQVAARQHALRITVPEPEQALDVDGTRIAQAVSNLLINASKYTAPGGNLELTVAREGSQILIEVRDDGIGIAAERLDDVFEMFSQVDPKLQGAQGGLGIGLALVRTVATLHGGWARAASAGLGRGSTFSLALPVGRASAPAASPGLGGAARASSRRVLVVDDNADAAEVLAVMLSTRGYRTAVVHDGGSALAASAADPPDIVILDIGLPDLTGYDVARALRAQPRASPLGIIALTGWGTEQDKDDARAAGFDLHLTKPVDETRLQAALVHVEGIVGKPLVSAS